MAELPSSIRKVIESFERLPGVGPKSAARLAFYLLATPKSFVEEFAQTILTMKATIKKCRQCFGVAEAEVCDICSDPKRNQRQICIVERALDVIAFERAGGFGGVYHVLGGVINPLDHVGPEDLTIEALLNRVEKLRQLEGVIEVVIATNPTMEGEATALYIKDQLNRRFGELVGKVIKITRIGSGLPMGADVEYADQATLSRALEGRREL
ncbi:recombination mediator RecR [Patescibacteria group bacterium]|nr:recombination mediator RecR [Patescibacteria group bacterium]